MDTELQNWLGRENKSFKENLQFALKTWQSAEFTLPAKYDIILNWIIGQLMTDSNKTDPPITELKELCQLRAQSGLIITETKSKFVKAALKVFDDISYKEHTNRDVPELLRLLMDFELLQDLYRSDLNLYALVFGTFLKQYKMYVQNSKEEFKPRYESDFIINAINNFKENAKRTSKPSEFGKAYTNHAVEPLMELQIVLRENQLNLFVEILLLEEITSQEYSEEELIKRCHDLPIHVKLLTLEYAVVNRRSILTFQKELIKDVFNSALENCDNSTLITGAYILEVLRKHDVALINNTDNKTKPALTLIGDCLYAWVESNKNTRLREVLLLLCSTLRYNPLILEQQIFKITTWMIVAYKNKDNDEQQLFEDYLQLLLDMFRRLSRAEKFVVNLLKALKEWLLANTLSPQHETKKKRKSLAANGISSDPIKLQKLSNGTAAEVHSVHQNEYINIIEKDLKQNGSNNASSIGKNLQHVHESFPALQDCWPNQCVGVAFSRIITGLMSKPSLTIWKSLCYYMKEHLTKLEKQAVDDLFSENDKFLMDMHAALLCQYLNGCKLVEQADKFLTQITETRALTADVLGQFGRLILAREHEQRLINAFMECCYSLGNFEMLLMYYKPDGITDNQINVNGNVEQMHSYLSSAEWLLLKQRIWNFGSSRCKHLFNRLLLQRHESKHLLLEQENTKINLMQTITGEDSNIPLDVTLKDLCATWLISTRERHEKLDFAASIYQRPDLFNYFSEDLETVEIVTFKVFENLCRTMQKQCKKSLLSSLNSNFKELCKEMEPSVIDSVINPLIAVIMQRLEEYHLKSLPVNEMQAAITALTKLPIAYARRPTKWVIFMLLLAFYRDLIAGEEAVLAVQVYDLLSDFLHFGNHLAICKYFSTQAILKLLPLEACMSFYDYLFDTIKAEEKGAADFLISLSEHLKPNEKNLSNEERKLLLTAIEHLTNTSGSGLKRLRLHLKTLLDIYGTYVQAHFANHQNLEENSKKHKKFVEKTLVGYAPYANALLMKTNLDKETEPTLISEEFCYMTKIYVGHSVDYRNPCAIRLMKVALNHRERLKLSPTEVELILSAYWRQLNEDLKTGKELDPKTSVAVVKMIIDNKTNEDLLLILKDLQKTINSKEENDSAHAVDSVKNVLSLLALIGKCQFSTIKGAIFNEQFKQITTIIAMSMRQNERQQFKNLDQIHAMLSCQQFVVENKMVPLSIDALDSILGFLIDVNIKKFEITDTNVKEFKSLHLAMSELCDALLKHRYILLMDRITQFMQIFKDLLQSVVWFKSDRQKNITLTPSELDDLSELALKMATLMSHITAHSIHVKRIAPFVLTFVINLMVSNKRPTTLYTKIKTHVESICYDLIGICDHRSGRFILRCSNEAGRQLYEHLLMDHKKYRKFKGKV